MLQRSAPTSNSERRSLILGIPDPLFSSTVAFVRPVPYLGHRAFWQPFQRFRHLDGYHCARANFADYGTLGREVDAIVEASESLVCIVEWLMLWPEGVDACIRAALT